MKSNSCCGRTKDAVRLDGDWLLLVALLSPDPFGQLRTTTTIPTTATKSTKNPKARRAFPPRPAAGCGDAEGGGDGGGGGYPLGRLAGRDVGAPQSAQKRE